MVAVVIEVGVMPGCARLLVLALLAVVEESIGDLASCFWVVNTYIYSGLKDGRKGGSS